MPSICNENFPTPSNQSHKAFCAHFHKDLQDYSKENLLWIAMVAKNPPVHCHLCWNGGGDSLHNLVQILEEKGRGRKMKVIDYAFYIL